MNVPKLRFGEFAIEEFQKSTLGNLTKWSSGGTPSKENPNFWEGDIPWISASSMRGLYYSDSEIHITSEGLKNGSKLAEKGNLLLLVRGSMLFNKIPVGIAERDLAFNQDVKSLKPNQELNASYLLQWFQASEHNLLSMVVGTGIGAGKLETSDVQSINFLLPSKEEQQKIADFLSAVDDKITALTAQKTALTQYKQGMMQRIFAQTLRFKDDNGADYLEWEEMRLGDLLDYEQPTKYLVSSTEYQNDYPTPVLTAGKTFILGYTDEQNGIFTDLPVIIFDDFTTANKFVNFPFKAKSSAMKMLKNDSAKSNLRFIYETMQLLDFATGDEHKRYWISEYQEQFIFMPCLEEQTKIAQFLTELDDKINAVDAQILSAQQWKQGLLQQLFV